MSVRGALAACAVVLTLAPGASAQAQHENAQHVSMLTTQMSASKSGYETFQVGVNFDSNMVQDVYALFGQAGDLMVIPPAFQAAAPFGSDVGPVRIQAASPTPAIMPAIPARQPFQQEWLSLTGVRVRVFAPSGQPGLLPDDARRAV
jgi:hypothetical protein